MAILGYLDGLGSQFGGILSGALGASGEGFVNRLKDPEPVVPFDRTPVMGDAKNSDRGVSLGVIDALNNMPIYAKIGVGLIGLVVVYKVLK